MLLGLAHPPRSSARLAAELDIAQSGFLALHVDGDIISASLDNITISDRVGSLPRKITFPNGWLFVPSDNHELESYLAKHGEKSWLSKLERHVGAIFASMVLIVAMTVGVFSHGIPWLTQTIVNNLPPSVSEVVGEQVLETLDKQWLSPSELAPNTQDEIRKRFAAYVAQLPNDYVVTPKVVFRSWDNGPNAFALSDGTVVVLDSLVELADSSLQLDSILLHELGHVHHQHVMHSLVHSSLISLSVALLTGESSGVIDNLASVGVFVFSNGLSQQAEHQADQYAVKNMWQVHGSAEAMIEMFKGFQTLSDGELPKWLSSHPELDERIEAVRQYRE